jgi:hypothetical protein
MFLPLGWWHQVASLDVSLSFSYSCLAVPNQFQYPDPSPSVPARTQVKAPDIAGAIQSDLHNVVLVEGAADVVEAQFKDGSTMRFHAVESSMEVHVDRTGSRAAHYAERVSGAAIDGRAIQCHFADGSSIRLVPFG